MLQATTQQLQLVRRREERLQAVVRNHITTLRYVRAEREVAHARCEELRKALADAEARFTALDRQHVDLTQALRESTSDFASTQLLRKKLCNTRASLRGHPLLAVRLNDESPSRGATKPAMEVSDACTVVDKATQRSFAVDLAYSPVGLSAHCTSNTPEGLTDEMSVLSDGLDLPHVAGEVLSGYSFTFLSFHSPDASGGTVLLGRRRPFASPRSSSRPSSDAVRVPPEKGTESCETPTVIPMFSQPCTRSPSPCSVGSSSSSEGAGGNGVSPSPLSTDRHCGTHGGLACTLLEQMLRHVRQTCITHFRVSCSVVEVVMNEVIDLLSATRNLSSLLRSDVPEVRKGSGAHRGVERLYGVPHLRDTLHPSEEDGALPTARVSAVRVDSVSDLELVLQRAGTRRGRWLPRHEISGTHPTPVARETESGSKGFTGLEGGDTPSHVVLTLYVEAFDARGHYRRSMVRLVDWCVLGNGGAATSPLSVRDKAADWLRLTQSYWSDAVTVIAEAEEDCHYVESAEDEEDEEDSEDALLSEEALTSQARVSALSPRERLCRRVLCAVAGLEERYRGHVSVMAHLLQPVFAGRSRTLLLCDVDTAGPYQATMREVLAYAFNCRRVLRHVAVPYDVPPELQRQSAAVRDVLQHHAATDEHTLRVSPDTVVEA